MNISDNLRRTVSETSFRILFSLIFLVAGAGHFLSPEKIAKRLAGAPMGHLAILVGPPDLLVLLAGIALLVGGAALLLGFRTQLAALLLIGVLIPITATVQIGAGDLGPLFKNVALLGGLIFFAANGSPEGSLDGIRVRRSSRAL